MSKRKLSRREFISAGAITTAGMLLFGQSKFLLGQSNTKTRVILIRNQKVVDAKGKVNSEVIQKMLDDAVTKLFDIDDPVKAWKKIIKPEDIVGIKTNVWNYLRTPQELEQAIKSRVMNCGVSDKNISIDDRGILDNPVFKKATALINTRPMRTHYWSGVGSLLKNYIMFAEEPSDYHDDSCADLAAIWKLPHVKGKTRLNVLVMLTPLFHSVGPHGYSAEYTWQYKGLIVGTDPVACDAVGLRIIEAKRKEYFKEDRPLNPPAKHIALADTRHHLGTADLNKIELIKLGWNEQILI
ncbi:MAG: DUF362 domain-containing protein [Bacteroidota bacterium]